MDILEILMWIWIGCIIALNAWFIVFKIVNFVREKKDKDEMPFMKVGKGILRFLLTLIRMAIISAAISLVLTFIYWLFGVIAGKSNGFLLPFIGGAIGIFGIWFILSLIGMIRNSIRFKKDPVYKSAFMNVGLDWNTYNSLKKQHKSSDLTEPEEMPLQITRNNSKRERLLELTKNFKVPQ